MNKTHYILTAFTATLALAGSATAFDPLEGYEQVEPAPSPPPPEATAAGYPAEMVKQGRYLVGLLGCGNCHTDGALAGRPDPDRLLAGSGVGIARSDPMSVLNPGVVFPPNLTPDPDTGIGRWSLEQIETMLESGIDRHGRRAVPVMPSLIYSQLRPGDATAIAMYLKSLPPVRHEIPDNVQPGKRSQAPFVHFGVYRSTAD